jgi:hypothetical protein
VASECPVRQTVASNLNVSPSVRPLYRRWPYDYTFNGSLVMVVSVISPSGFVGLLLSIWLYHRRNSCQIFFFLFASVCLFFFRSFCFTALIKDFAIAFKDSSSIFD